MTKKLLAVLFFTIILSSLSISAVIPVSASGFRVISAAASSPNTGLKQISIDESADGTTITMHVGDSLKVNLEYYVIPYIWHLGQFDTSVLQNVDHYTIVPPPPTVGAGTEVWVFTATGVGTSPIFLDYRRVSDGAVDKTFSVTVNVLALSSVPASSNLTVGILVAFLTAFIIWLILKKPRQSQI
jgi:predicted secreted protein